MFDRNPTIFSLIVPPLTGAAQGIPINPNPAVGTAKPLDFTLSQQGFKRPALNHVIATIVIDDSNHHGATSRKFFKFITQIRDPESLFNASNDFFDKGES